MIRNGAMGSSLLVAMDVLPLRTDRARHSDLVDSDPGWGVLDDGVVDALLAHLGTQSRILGHGDTLVINQNTCARCVDAFDECFYDRLLLAENFALGMCVFTSTLMFTLIKKTSVSEDTEACAIKNDAILGRIYTVKIPAVFGALR